jgi:hypothetical protein
MNNSSLECQDGFVAQLVEQRTLNPLVEGSNPSGSTKTNKLRKIEQNKN